MRYKSNTLSQPVSLSVISNVNNDSYTTKQITFAVHAIVLFQFLIKREAHRSRCKCKCKLN